MTDINKARTVDLQIQDVFLEFAQSTKEDKYITAIAKIKALVVDYREGQLSNGAKQLQMNIQALRKLHAARGLDTSTYYTKNTEDLLKIQFANQCLGEIRSIYEGK